MRSLLATVVLVLPGVALAHLGTIPSTAKPTSPTGPCDITDASYDIHWTDFDTASQGTATSSVRISWYYTQASVPTYLPGAHPVGIAGVKIAGNIPEMDPANELLWDTSSLSAGAYWLYSLADDTPFEMYTFSRGPVVVAHAGDTPWPTVVITDPDGIKDVADASFLLAYDTCDSTGTGNVKIEATPSGDGTGLIPVADDLPSGPGTFQWDTSALPNGFWTLKATITDAQQRSFYSFPQYFVRVNHPSGTGGTGGDETGGAGGVAGTGGAAGTGGTGGSGGTVSRPPPSGGCSCAAGTLALAPLFLRRRRGSG